MWTHITVTNYIVSTMLYILISLTKCLMLYFTYFLNKMFQIDNLKQSEDLTFYELHDLTY